MPDKFLSLCWLNPVCRGQLYSHFFLVNRPESCQFLSKSPFPRRSGRATWFLSWVWGYKFSTVFGALSRWWKRHQIVSGDVCGDVYIWWCVMVNNQSLGGNSGSQLIMVKGRYEQNLKAGPVVLGRWQHAILFFSVFFLMAAGFLIGNQML